MRAFPRALGLPVAPDTEAALRNAAAVGPGLRRIDAAHVLSAGSSFFWWSDVVRTHGSLLTALYAAGPRVGCRCLGQTFEPQAVLARRKTRVRDVRTIGGDLDDR